MSARYGAAIPIYTVANSSRTDLTLDDISADKQLIELRDAAGGEILSSRSSAFRNARTGVAFPGPPLTVKARLWAGVVSSLKPQASSLEPRALKLPTKEPSVIFKSGTQCGDESGGARCKVQGMSSEV